MWKLASHSLPLSHRPYSPGVTHLQSLLPLSPFPGPGPPRTSCNGHGLRGVMGRKGQGLEKESVLHTAAPRVVTGEESRRNHSRLSSGIRWADWEWVKITLFALISVHMENGSLFIAAHEPCVSFVSFCPLSVTLFLYKVEEKTREMVCLSCIKPPPLFGRSCGALHAPFILPASRQWFEITSIAYGKLPNSG